ncbi:hypothetical protein FH966_07810 [Lentibacillus cibarius]|uniref:Uncharacterized protein n=1 Tax=Lentibacillus cibarius TaxID=2583219 RepID=A0A549YIA0_9BACI|nr:hypothetical protein [Lentibacillus cibarius]TRM11606.1 hypothetical protein FH966_07810 [Lentibacillus cibarius]
MFLSVFFFTANLEKPYGLSQADLDYDIKMFTGHGFSEQFVNGVKDLDTVIAHTLVVKKENIIEALKQGRYGKSRIVRSKCGFLYVFSYTLMVDSH